MSHRKALVAVIQNAELNRFNSQNWHIVMHPKDIDLLTDEIFEYYAQPKHTRGKLETFMGWGIKPDAFCPIGTIFTRYNVKNVVIPNILTSIDNWK